MVCFINNFIIVVICMFVVGVICEGVVLIYGYCRVLGIILIYLCWAGYVIV